MRETAVVVINGVLRKIVGEDPIKPGVMLFTALASLFSTVLVGDRPRSDTEWLDEQGIKYDMLHAVSGMSHTEVVNALRFDYGYNVSVVVEPDPEQAASLFDEGYTVLGYMHPSFSHPSWRPLHGPGSDAVPWTELRQVVMRDKLEKAAEERLKPQEEE